MAKHPHWHYLYTIDKKLASLSHSIDSISNAKFSMYKDYVEKDLSEWDGISNVPTVAGLIAMKMASEILNKMQQDYSSLSEIRSRVQNNRNGKLKPILLDTLKYNFDIDPKEKVVTNELFNTWLAQLDDLLLKINSSSEKLQFPYRDYFDNDYSPQEPYEIITQNNTITEKKVKPGRKRKIPDIPMQPEDALKVGDFYKFNATKNYIEGKYEIVGGGVGVSRDDAKKMKRDIEDQISFEDRSKLFVTSYKRGTGHYVIFVPEENLQRIR